MAGLYDLDIDAQIVDDWAIQWDDPDFSLIVTYNVTIIDAIGITDSAPTTTTYDRTITDNVGITDSNAKTLEHPIVDAVGLLDTASTLTTYARTITDNVGITDSITKEVDAEAPVLESSGVAVNQLGCGKIGVFLVARATPTTIIADLTGDLAGGTTITRVLNDVGSASITLKDCYSGPPIYPWVHSLLFAWDGEYIWNGPVTKVSQDGNNQGHIEAQDIMAWMRKRVVLDTFDSIGAAVDASAAFATIVADGFDQDATVSYVITAAVTGITIERQWLADQFNYVRDIVDELVVTGSDWTVFLNEIFAGDVEASVVTSFSINESHWRTKPTVTYAGDDQANWVYVVGDEGIVNLQASPLWTLIYGRLALVENETDIKDMASAQDRARGILDFRRVHPVLIEAIELLPTAPMTINDLIPGIEFMLNVPGSIAGYDGDARLQSVDIVEIEAEGRWGVTLHCNTLPVYPEE